MKSKKCVGFLSWLLLCAFILTPFFAQAVRSSGAWQELTEQTAAINGTPPQADSVTIPVYQGSVQLRSDAANSVDYSAKPSQFSTSDAGSALTLTNPHDTEGDIFADPPLAWQAERAPTVTLVWADAATPDTPLSPQPSANLTFCEQNMAGRHRHGERRRRPADEKRDGENQPGNVVQSRQQRRIGFRRHRRYYAT